MRRMITQKQVEALDQLNNTFSTIRLGYDLGGEETHDFNIIGSVTQPYPDENFYAIDVFKSEPVTINEEEAQAINTNKGIGFIKLISKDAGLNRDYNEATKILLIHGQNIIQLIFNYEEEKWTAENIVASAGDVLIFTSNGPWVTAEN